MKCLICDALLAESFEGHRAHYENFHPETNPWKEPEKPLVVYQVNVNNLRALRRGEASLRAEGRLIE